jgi:hypothetical protein
MPKFQIPKLFYKPIELKVNSISELHSDGSQTELHVCNDCKSGLHNKFHEDICECFCSNTSKLKTLPDIEYKTNEQVAFELVVDLNQIVEHCVRLGMEETILSGSGLRVIQFIDSLRKNHDNKS